MLRSQMEIIAVVCTKDRPGRVAIFVEHFIKIGFPPMTLLVVDSTSDPMASDRNKEGVQTLKSMGWNAHHLPDSPGLPHQRNTAIDYISKNLPQAKFVAFLDDDVLISKDYFENLLSVFDSDPDLVVVGGFDQEAEQPKSTRYYPLARLSILPSHPGQIAKSGLAQVPSPTSNLDLVDFVPGGMQTLKLSRMGGLRFNEQSRFFGEDIEMHFRLAEFGKIASSLSLPVVHLDAQEGKNENGAKAVQEQLVRLRLHFLNPKRVRFFPLILGSALVMIHEVFLQILKMRLGSAVVLMAQHLWGMLVVFRQKIIHEFYKQIS